jgi:hypothetical protein
MMAPAVQYTASVIWLPFGPPRRPQSPDIDRAIVAVWRACVEGRLTEEEAGRRDAELRAQRSTIGRGAA